VSPPRLDVTVARPPAVTHAQKGDEHDEERDREADPGPARLDMDKRNANVPTMISFEPRGRFQKLRIRRESMRLGHDGNQREPRTARIDD